MKKIKTNKQIKILKKTSVEQKKKERKKKRAASNRKQSTLSTGFCFSRLCNKLNGQSL